METINDGNKAPIFPHQSENELFEVRILKIDNDGKLHLVEILNGVVCYIFVWDNRFEKAPSRRADKIARCGNLYLCLSGRIESGA